MNRLFMWGTIAVVGGLIVLSSGPAALTRGGAAMTVQAAPVDTGVSQTGAQPFSGSLRQDDPCAAPDNPIVAENCLPGTSDWIVKNDLGDIEGFAYPPSVNKGASVDFFVNTGAPRFEIAIYRSGYYQGTGGRFIDAVELEGTEQPACDNDLYTTGLTSCSNWSASHSLTIPDDWTTGIYVAKLTRADTNGEAYMLFVVRDDDSGADILYQQSLFTYHAYNNFGGKSVYTFNSGTCETDSLAARGVKVSLYRPFGPGMGITANFFNNYFRVEYPMVQWLEAQGYDVAYTTNLDTHRSGKPDTANELLDHRVFLSVGHDEYWTQEMRDAITEARDAGVHIGFFGANIAYWRVRLEPDPWTGEPDSVIVTYKTTEAGRPDPSGHPTGTWRDPEGVNDPENSLLGVMYIGDNDSFYFPLRVDARYTDDPIYRHTDLQDMPPETYVNIGDRVIGWEWDAAVDNGYSPENLDILAATPVYGFVLLDAGNSENGTSDFATTNVTRYVAPSGAIVFAAGTIQWSWGLGAQGIEPVETDPYIQQITYNVLADMGVQPASPVDSLVLDGEEGVVGYGEAAFIPASAPAPTISDINISTPLVGITTQGRIAEFQWWTDVKTQGQIWLGERAGHTNESHGFLLLEDYSRLHALETAILWPDTEYFARIMAVGENGQIAVSDELSFRTPDSRVVKAMRAALDGNAALQCWVGKSPTQARNVGIGALATGVVVLALFGRLSWGWLRQRRRNRNAPAGDRDHRS